MLPIITHRMTALHSMPGDDELHQQKAGAASSTYPIGTIRMRWRTERRDLASGYHPSLFGRGLLRTQAYNN